MTKSIVLCILFCMCIIACKKKVYEKEMPTYGETSTEINGVKWSNDIKDVIYDEKGFSFFAFKYKEVGGVHTVFEILSFHKIEQTKDRQTVRAWIIGQPSSNPDSIYLDATFTTTQADGDVSCDLFQILETDSVNNWIQITKEEGNYNEVWGNYSATFTRHSGCASSPYTDTLRMRNGSFHFKFK